MNWYTTSQQTSDENFIIAYHGSDIDGIKSLKASNPSYVGGIGYGVYLGLNYETAEYYGSHIYKCKINFSWDKVLDLSPENFYLEEGFEGHSIGLEQIPPFSFYINNQKYLVTEMEETYGNSWIKNSMLLNKFESLIKEKDPWWKPYVVPLIEKMRKYAEFGVDKESVDESFWDVVSGLEGENLPGGFKEEEIENKIELATNEIFSFVEQIKKEFSTIEISLEEIGEIAEQAGYLGVYLEGVRVASINEELLVFDENNVVVLEQVN